MPPYIYLASKSPRRQELLSQCGIQFQLLVPDYEEDAEALEERLPSESARHYVQRVTALKAGAAAVRQKHRKLPDAPILAADTTVALGGRILGKPEDEEEAYEMLSLLSGTTHRVLTAVAVCQGTRMEMYLSQSRVTMRDLSASDIKRYIASGEPFGKAGAYAIQGRAATFVSHLAGSHSGVVGLPMFETALLLSKFGIPV